MTTAIKKETWMKYSLRSLLLTLLVVGLLCFLMKVFYFNRSIPYVPKPGDRVRINAHDFSPELKIKNVLVETNMPNEPGVVYYSHRRPDQLHVLQNIQVQVNNDLIIYEYDLMPNSPLRDTLEKRHRKLLELVEQKLNLEQFFNSPAHSRNHYIPSLENQLSAFPFPKDHSTIGYLRGSPEADAFYAADRIGFSITTKNYRYFRKQTP